MSEYFEYLAKRCMGVAGTVKPLCRATAKDRKYANARTVVCEPESDRQLAEVPEKVEAANRPAVESAEQDIFVAQFQSAASAAAFSDKSILAGLGRGERVEMPVEPAAAKSEPDMIATESPATAAPAWNAEMTFAEAFSGINENQLIETILPVVQGEAPRGILAEAMETATRELAVAAQPAAPMIEPHVNQFALARIEQVRSALFGTTKPEDKTIALPIEESKPLAG